MSMSSEYRGGFQMGKPIKSRNAERGRAAYVHSFPPEGCINSGTGSANLQNLPRNHSSGCRTAGYFCQLFVRFQIQLVSTNARLDPSRERGTSEATDKLRLSALPQLLPHQQRYAAPNNFSFISPFSFLRKKTYV